MGKDPDKGHCWAESMRNNANITELRSIRVRPRCRKWKSVPVAFCHVLQNSEVQIPNLTAGAGALGVLPQALRP